VYGDLVLAPMDGFSDLPFRSLCREHGSAMSYTAFVSAQSILDGSPHAQRELRYWTEERPVVFQIFDDSPERLLAAALRVLPLGPDILDINMGCSVRCVSGRGAGAGLLRQPAKIGSILRSLTRALPIPVTAKIRLGWDDASRNYLQVARIIEDSGGAAIAVHARTRAQGYGGQADWDAIAAVRQAVRIPVLGNGDVRELADIDRLLAHTGCQAVMIGRGSMGNPWIFSRRPRRCVSAAEAAAVIEEHLARMLEHHGPERAVILFRKHLTRYLEVRPPDGELRSRLLAAETSESLRAALAEAGLGVAPAPASRLAVAA
jgi:nifR3 family TIM-barrel protein